MKILVVDDHALIREGLRAVLGRLEPGLEVVEANSVASALRHIQAESGFDLAIIDLFLPDGSGIQIMDELGYYHPDVPMIAVSGEEEGAQEAYRHGAVGFIAKSALNDTLLEGVQTVLAGGVWMPDSVRPAESLILAADRFESSQLELTDRQKAVLSLMMKGFSNRGISEKLALSVSTVKIHVSAILRTLQVKSRTQAVLTATRMQLIEPF